MEKIKQDLKKSFKEKVEKGLPREEALSQTLVEKREFYEKEEFSEAVKEFLKEIAESYSLENLTEADPLEALAEGIYLEYEFLLAKIKKLFS